ncbi:MAG: J domain-containing protein [Candidatus Margulisiibacteriota bacterium]
MSNHIASNFDGYTKPKLPSSSNKLSFDTLRPQIMSENYYDRLNVSTLADGAKIKKAYIALVLKVHPDKHNDHSKLCNELTMKLNEAYDCLSDSQSRKKYDEYLSGHGDAITDHDSDSDGDFVNKNYETHFPKDEFRFNSFVDLFKVLDGFDEFKDDIFTIYMLSDSNLDSFRSPSLRNGFNDLLSSFLAMYNIRFDEIYHWNETAVLYDSALLDLTLQPQSCGFLTRRVYVAIPLKFPIENDRLIRLEYGQRYISFLKVLNHPHRKMMQYQLPDVSKIRNFFLALKNYQN